MSAIKVNFEIGHEASLKSKPTPEGFTHDWVVFVRGQEGAVISHFVDKVVFHLHDTFPKPKRVVKVSPFSIKESGYAGFTLPIDIYLKNKDEPKKIKFTYELTLQHSGFLKDRYIFQNPNEDFKKKLLKGGGISVSNNAFYTNPDQESRSRDSFTDEKQLISKPKLSSDNIKKHKSKEHKEDNPHRNSCFENLFGPPIQKPPKVSPEPKKVERSIPAATVATPIKPEKKEKDRQSSDKKVKHEHKDIKSDKVRIREEKEKIRTEKVKSHSKDEKAKEKNNKRPSERLPSPEATKKRCFSPNKRTSSPQQRSGSASSMKEEYKPKHVNVDNFEPKKAKVEEKSVDIKVDKEVKEKKKKDKKSHDRDKERKDKKEYKKESHKSKESPKDPKEMPKSREVLKDKEPSKESPILVKEKQIKPEKPINKFSIENLRKTPPPEIEDRIDNHKSKEKSDPERRHKHKKKDKKRDESREKHKDINKDKKHKHDKIREAPPEKPEVIECRDLPKERPTLEPASPISIDTASQCSSKSGLMKTSQTGAEDINSSRSDSESSIIADEDDSKHKIDNTSPASLKREPSLEPDIEPDPEPEPEVEPEPEPVVEPPPIQKEKSKKHKDKSSKKEEKRRKRKAAEEEEIENRKLIKNEGGPSNGHHERAESSGSTSVETKVQDNGVSSSLGEDAEPGDLSPDYMVQLRGLQKRIMMISNNEDLERVVNLIAETGRYEVTTQTFDFDLCLLDRSTVQQLMQLVGC